MPSIMKSLGVVVAGLAAMGSAMPAQPRLTRGQMKIHDMMKRQNAAAKAAGLTDFDILQFALTLEWLETTFYQQGFQKFPAADFKALGLNDQQLTDLTNVGQTEQAHVVLLQSALAQNNVQPVQPCTYNFGFTDAKGMIATAAVLENVGVSAYLGAAPLVTSPSILSTAGSILTVEGRHQALVRVVSNVAAAPGAFDTALSPKQVFSLAAPFITACPTGSNLAITAFPTLTMAAGAGGAMAAATAGQMIQLQSSAAGNAKFCAFTNGGILPAGTAFTPFTQATGCQVPPNMDGISYVNLVSSQPTDQKLVDENILAGPMVMMVN